MPYSMLVLPIFHSLGDFAPYIYVQHYGCNVCDAAKDAVLALKLYTFLIIKRISSVKYMGFFGRPHSKHSSCTYISSSLFDWIHYIC